MSYESNTPSYGHGDPVFSPSLSPSRRKTHHMRLMLPPKPREGFFDELYHCGFISVVVKALFTIVVLCVSLTALEMVVYGFRFPVYSPISGCCSSKVSGRQGFSCFLSSCDSKPRPYNGCVGCAFSGHSRSSPKSPGSWVMEVFTGCSGARTGR